MKEVIIFNSRDGLLRMDAKRIVLFGKDGNYTRVVSMISKDALKKMKELMIMAKI